MPCRLLTHVRIVPARPARASCRHGFLFFRAQQGPNTEVPGQLGESQRGEMDFWHRKKPSSWYLEVGGGVPSQTTEPSYRHLYTPPYPPPRPSNPTNSSSGGGTEYSSVHHHMAWLSIWHMYTCPIPLPNATPIAVSPYFESDVAVTALGLRAASSSNSAAAPAFARPPVAYRGCVRAWAVQDRWQVVVWVRWICPGVRSLSPAPLHAHLCFCR